MSKGFENLLSCVRACFSFTIAKERTTVPAYVFMRVLCPYWSTVVGNLPLAAGAEVACGDGRRRSRNSWSSVFWQKDELQCSRHFIRPHAHATKASVTHCTQVWCTPQAARTVCKHPSFCKQRAQVLPKFSLPVRTRRHSANHQSHVYLYNTEMLTKRTLHPNCPAWYHSILSKQTAQLSEKLKFNSFCQKSKLQFYLWSRCLSARFAATLAIYFAHSITLYWLRQRAWLAHGARREKSGCWANGQPFCREIGNLENTEVPFFD